MRRRQQPRDRYGRFVKKGNGAGTDFLVGALKHTFNKKNLMRKREELRGTHILEGLRFLLGIRQKKFGKGIATDAIVNNLTNQVNRRIGDAASETVDGIFDAGLNRLKRLFKRGKKSKKSNPSKNSSSNTNQIDLNQLSAIDRRNLGI